jgi:hypothetical protein
VKLTNRYLELSAEADDQDYQRQNLLVGRELL